MPLTCRRFTELNHHVLCEVYIHPGKEGGAEVSGHHTITDGGEKEEKRSRTKARPQGLQTLQVFYQPTEERNRLYTGVALEERKRQAKTGRKKSVAW